jgi:HK97 gp10 family phage protein
MTFEIKKYVTGGKECLAALNALDKKIRKKIVRKGVAAGAKVFVKAAKADAPRDSNALSQSMTSRIKLYDKRMVAIIGPRRGVSKMALKKGKKRVPANYAHLVEEGHRIASGGRLSRLRRRKYGLVFQWGPGQSAGFVPGRHFMRKSARRAEGGAIAAFRDTFETELGVAQSWL